MQPGASDVLKVRALQFDRAAPGEAPFRLGVEELRLRAGETLGIVGPSGCGKSTLLDLLGLLRSPSACGCFELMGVDIRASWQAADAAGCTAMRAQHIGFVLQTGGLLPSLSLRDNLELSPRLLGQRDPNWVRHLVRTLDLDGLEHRLPSALSVGQRQRAAVGRALAHRPALVLADEPTASIGPEHQDAVMQLLSSACQESGASLVVVSHDRALLERHGVALRTLALVGGTVRLGPAAN